MFSTSRSPRRGNRRIAAALLAAVTVAGIAACQRDSAGTDPVLPPDNPANPQFRNAAFVLDVNTKDHSVRISAPTLTVSPSLVGGARGGSHPGGPSFSILAGDVVELTTGNYTASAVGAFQPGKVRVEFDVFVTNRLSSVQLITPTFPEPPVGTNGIVLFPFSTNVTVTTGGTTVGGDGTEVTVEQPNYGAVEPSIAWDGTPFNFFNDTGCPVGANDCYRYQLFGQPLAAGSTSEAQRVGFDIDPTVGNFRARLIVAADLQNSGPALTGTIAGTVSSPQRGPLDGVTVSAGAFSDGTDATGAYSIASVPTGPRSVTLSALPAGCTNPGAQATTVSAGATSTVNFTVVCTAFVGTVAGTVTSSLGGGIAGVSVVVTPTGGSAQPAGTTSGVGAYSVPGVPVGAGTGSLALGNLPAGCTNPGPQAYAGLTNGGTATVDVTVACTPPPAGYAYSATWGPVGTTVTLTMSINMSTFNDPAINGAGPDDILSFQGAITYPSARLQFASCANVAGSGLSSVTINSSVAGTLQVGNFTTSPPLFGAQGIAACTFNVIAGAPVTFTTATTLTEVLFSTGDPYNLANIIRTEGTITLP